jgi:hypothetical protein
VATNAYGWNALFVCNDLAAGLLPEISIEDGCLHPWNAHGMRNRWPLVAHLPWQERVADHAVASRASCRWRVLAPTPLQVLRRPRSRSRRAGGSVSHGSPPAKRSAPGALLTDANHRAGSWRLGRACG